MTTFTFIFAIIFESSLLIFFWLFFLCICIDANDLKTQNFRSLYHKHTNSNLNSVSRCNWFTQTKKTQKNYDLRKHELKIKNKLKEKMKQLTKQKKKIRLIKKRTKKYICKRYKHSIKFNNNIKFHEHIRIRHAKKSKFVQKFVVSFVFESKFSMSSRSIIFLSFTSSKFIFFSMFASEIVYERSKNISFILLIATSKKSIF